MNQIPNDAMIVVADGEGARVFRNTGDEQSIALKQVELHELMNMNDDGPAGSMPGGSNPKQLDEATFAKQLAHGLNEGALKQRYEYLVLIADPVTLGRVRPLLHKEATQRMVMELGKTFTNAAIEDIERALS